MLILPKNYPITNVELSGLSHADQVRSLAEAGCRFVQIREKSASSRAFYDDVVKSLQLAEEFAMKVIVNDRVDIAIAAKAHGIHLGQDDLPPDEARKLLGDSAIIGYSTHSVEQAVEATEMPIDYIAVGPIFPTSTKENPDPVVGLNGLIEVRSAIGDLPLVAIGGIRLENIPAVLNSGADSVALISALFEGERGLAEMYLRASRLAET